MAGYANLQLILGSRTEAARERIMYVITAYMDAQGLMPCGRDSAERTVRFARGEDGVWAVFDDEADRMDIRALDGLGRCLTGKLHAKAVGMMGTERGRMLRREEEAPPGLVTLYFCTANRVRQRLIDRLIHPAARTAANAGALIRPPRCRLWQ